MQTFLINLARRPDRLEAMARQLDALGIAFERVDAVDAQRIDSGALGERFAARGPLGPLAPGDKACTLSHLHLWNRIASGADEYAAILEDDVVLSPEAGKFLQDSDWIPRAVQLVKLERFGGAGQILVAGRPAFPALDRQIVPIRSRHTGSAGYVISRELARRLSCMTEKITVPIDHLLFHPANSPIFRDVRPWQLLPALLEQRDEIGRGTDIHATRQSVKPRGWSRVVRDLTRNYHEVRLLPRQLAAILSGRARVIRIGLR